MDKNKAREIAQEVINEYSFSLYEFWEKIIYITIHMNLHF